MPEGKLVIQPQSPYSLLTCILPAFSLVEERLISFIILLLDFRLLQGAKGNSRSILHSAGYVQDRGCEKITCAVVILCHLGRISSLGDLGFCSVFWEPIKKVDQIRFFATLQLHSFRLTKIGLPVTKSYPYTSHQETCLCLKK